ncbi:MAG: sugar phosphate isomerase/epimerase [Candidatus Omnitrophica bacterium]|nr:sugar phosphate isomerase/epimerase [Candidatus Omnitrophota bacterium]
MAFLLSGFGDEISPDLKEQLGVLVSEGIRHLEIRGVDKKNVLDLTRDDMDKIKKELHSAGIGISAVGSPIGKINIKDDFSAHIKLFENALDIAKFFETPYVRIFSYYITEGDSHLKYRDEVMRRMEKKAILAKKAGITLVLENEHGIYGDTPERCLDIFNKVGMANLRATFDPGNYVFEGVAPFNRAYPLLEEFIEYIHIKDARIKDKEMTPAGEGDGEIREVLTALNKKGYRGFLSIEPHLKGGASPADNFKRASRALKNVIAESGASYK